MSNQTSNPPVEIFTTCPIVGAADRQSYLKNVIDTARWSEQYGSKGILVYTDNSLLDPWLVSQIILQNTETLCPLVAVQPVYMHPYSVAKTVTSLGHLYDRRVYLNMVAGGFKGDLLALNDTTPHDQRYDRLVEYTTIIKELLAGESPVTYEGQFYKVDRLKLAPPLRQDLFPGILMSGSSDAGLAAARAIGATAVTYPGPSWEYVTAGSDDTLATGIRVGIITRQDEEEAWEIAWARFPEDRKGQLTHQLAMKTSDSEWHKQLSSRDQVSDNGRNPYWLTPFQNHKTFCPYLVGSHERVAQELASYIETGTRTIILDIPASEEELHHTSIAFQMAAKELIGA